MGKDRLMFPWGHAALGYLLYSGWRHIRFDDRPSAVPVLALVLGTQVPDLIDKPLSWTFSLLPSGRSLGHSVLVLGLVGICLVGIGRWWRARRGTLATNGGPDFAGDSKTWVSPAIGALLLGWGSHLVGDSWVAFVGLGDCASYLLWPVLPICEYPEANSSIIARFLNPELTPNFVLGLVLAGVAALVWIRDGKPGLGFVQQQFIRLVVPESDTE